MTFYFYSISELISLSIKVHSNFSFKSFCRFPPSKL